MYAKSSSRDDGKIQILRSDLFLYAKSYGKMQILRSDAFLYAKSSSRDDGKMQILRSDGWDSPKTDLLIVGVPEFG